MTDGVYWAAIGNVPCSGHISFYYDRRYGSSDFPMEGLWRKTYQTLTDKKLFKTKEECIDFIKSKIIGRAYKSAISGER